MTKEDKKFNWRPIILAVFSLFFCVCGYAYTRDMSYLRESITEIRIDQKDNSRKYENLEKRVRELEIKMGDK